MSKKEVLTEYQTDLTDPGSEKSGEYLHEHILKRTLHLLSIDRQGVVDVCRDWLLSREDLYVMLALDIIKTYQIQELINDLCQLKKDVEVRKILSLVYLRWINETISVVENSSL